MSRIVIQVSPLNKLLGNDDITLQSIDSIYKGLLSVSYTYYDLSNIHTRVQLIQQPVFNCLILTPRLHDTTGCHTSLTSGLTTLLNEQPLFVQPVAKPGCTTGLTTGCIHDTAGCQTGCMFVYTIQPVVKPV